MIDIEELCRDAIEGIKDDEGVYTEDKLIQALKHIIRNTMSGDEIRKSVIQVSLELTNDIEPKWQYVAAKLYTYELYDKVKTLRGIKDTKDLYRDYYRFIKDLTKRNLYGKYILENYSKEDILELEKCIKPERDFIFNYSGIDLIVKRYLVQDFNRDVIELPQQMFMGIAMHLAIPENKENRVYWAKRFYDVLSSLKATMATPTMSNARKPF